MNKRLALLSILVLVVLFFSACGGGTSNSNTPPTMSVSVSLAPSVAQSIDQGQQMVFTAAVTNDSSNRGVTWAVSGGGTLSNATTTSATYNAPSSGASNVTATVTATSVADATKTASVTVTVAPSPVVTAPTAASLIGITGTAYNLTLQNSGGTAPFTWSVTSGTLPTGLTLSSAGVISGTPTVSGTSTFTVQVKDSAAAPVVATKQLIVTVNTPPAIGTQPANQMVNVGQTATFSVTATGSAPLTYQWKKGGVAIGGATASSYTTPPTVAGDNASQFTVTVSNVAGNVTSTPATLTVNVPPAIGTQPADQTVLEGQAASFSVVATGTAPLSYQWKKDGTNVSGATSSSYTTPATALADSGSHYSVTVTNVAGNVTSSSATLTVNPIPPAITTQPSNRTVIVGQTASFSVVATGSAPLSYQWKKGGTDIVGATTSSYTTPATVLADTGSTFTVTITNAGGNVTSNPATLTVNPAPPVISTQPANQTVQVGDTASFSVGVSGTAPFTYQWKKGNSDIGGATASTYTTPATTLADSGSQFSVTVTNAAGTVTSDPAILTVNPEPSSITGTAAIGLAIPNATVTLKDKLGATATGTTDASGNFSVVTTGMTPPFFLKIQPASGDPIYSVSADANASAIINIHPLTDLVVRSWYNAQGISMDTAFANPGSNPPPAPQEVGVLANVVTQVVQLWLTNAGITDPNFNLISTPFTAGTNSGLDHVLDQTNVDLTNASSPKVTITDGNGTTQTSVVTSDVSASSVTVSTTTVGPSGSSTSTVTTQVPTASAEQAALAAIQSSMTSFANTINTKGSALTVADILSFFDPNLLHGGVDQATFAASAATQFRGRNITLTVNRINSLNTTTGIADVLFTIVQAQGGVSQSEVQEFQFKNEGGTWMLYGDQHIASLSLQAEMRTNMGAYTDGNGPDINADVQMPQAVNGTQVLSGVTIAPLSVNGQTIFGGTPLTAPGVFYQGPTMVDTYSPTPTSAITVDSDHFFLLSNLLNPNILVPAGTNFTFTLTPKSGGPVTYTVPTTSFTTEAITITGMSTAAGPIPANEATDPNLANFPFNTPITVNWTLPKTFPINRVKLNAQILTGDQSKPDPNTFSCNIGEGPIIAVTATSGDITIPSTCHGLPVMQVDINLEVVGVNGERETVIYFFNGLPNNGGGGGISVTVTPPDAIVTAGDNTPTQFNANVTGTSNTAVDWSVSGTSCSGATCGTITSGGAYTPPADMPSPNNAVTITATAQADGTTKGTASVTIKPAVAVAPTITTQPANQTVAVGQTATFSVVATGTTPLSYQWKKNGTDIGGANSSSYTTPATVLADSGSTFTVNVSNAAGNLNSDPATLTVNTGFVTGTAAAGAPIGGATVVLKDSAGNSSNTTTASDGSFTLSTAGFTPPFLLQVQTANGNLYSVSADAQISTNINIHPYSDLVVRSWYNAQGLSSDAAFADPASTPAPDPATVQILQNTVTNMSQLWLTKAGVDTTQFNLISGTFAANGSGLDHVLDQTTVNLSNPTNPTVTITDGTTTQNSTITYDSNSSAVNVLSTTQNASGTTVTSVTAVVPTQSAQQTALNSINATVAGLVATVNAKGGALTGTDLLPYLASDLMQDGMNQAQYADLLASQIQVHSNPIASSQVLTINGFDNQTADIVFGFSKTQNGVTKIISREFWFENAGGTWLISGDRKSAGIQIRSETRTYLGTEFGTDGPALSAIVVAPTGTVQGATVTGGAIWNASPIPQVATIVQQPVNLDQFILMNSPIANMPAVGTLFDIAVTPTSGPVLHYSIPSNAFSTEKIHIVSPTDSSLAGAKLGQPLQVSWTLPTTFVVEQLGLTAEAFAGNVSNPATPVCQVSPAQPLATNATSTSITLPATCGGQPVQFVTVGVTATGSENQNSFSIMGFGNANGQPGSFSITTSSLPHGSVNTPYFQNLQTIGGTSPVTWSITSGNLPVGLTLDTGTGAISGTPTVAGVTSNFTVQAVDSSASHLTAQLPLSITIDSNNPGLSINTFSLPNGTVNVAYSQTLFASGGTPPITWSTVSGNLPAGLTLDSNSGLISGTPTIAGQSSFTVQATDSSSPNLTAQQMLSITVNSVAGFHVSGNISLFNSGGGPNGVQGASVSINTVPVQTTTTDSNGNFGFSAVPNGTYTITPSITGASSVFYPATQSVVVTGGDTFGISFLASVGYTVSGTVNYTGAKNGRIYLTLNGNNGFPLGTSIAAPGAFSIRGVAPGTYTLSAWTDSQGFGIQNASNPSGSTSGLTVAAGNVSNVSVTLHDPSSTPNLGTTSTKINTVGAFDQGVVMQFDSITDANGVELPFDYKIQWSTDPTFVTKNGVAILRASGGKDPVILSAANGLTGLTNGSALYFRVRGETENATSVSPYSANFGPVTIGALTGNNVVSGKVTFSGTATGPLYVGFYDQNTGNIYATTIAHPLSPQDYSVAGVPNGTNYFAFGIIDQNNDGIIDAGDVSNTDQGEGPGVVISGATAGLDLTLPGSNTKATLTTQHYRFAGQQGEGYNLNFDVRAVLKTPVALALVAGPNVLSPMDVAMQSGRAGRFQFWPSLNSIRPNPGDSYGLQVTYSDGTSELLSLSVTSVLDAFATATSPTSGSGNTTPTFSWTDPANAANYIYNFQLNDQNWNTIWRIPSNSNGFGSDITSVVWNVDPTGGNSMPSVPSLTVGTTYNWTITVMDAGGNSAMTQTSYRP